MKLMRWLSSLFALALILAVAGGVGVIYILNVYGSDLPDYNQLANYDPATVTRVPASGPSPNAGRPGRTSGMFTR